MVKLNFQQSLLQSSLLIIEICQIDAQETFIFIIINTENSWAS